MKVLFVVSIFNLFYCHSSNGEPYPYPYPNEPAPVQVDPAGGAILPTKLESRNGNPYLAYLGIPYAKPPVGDLRFRPPEKPDPWRGVRNSAYGPSCAQFGLVTESVEGDEDCLHLNVYRPEKVEKRLPVMVYLHAGAFMFFSSPNYKADYFMDHEIVLVTVNYRLGILGFLNAGVKEAQGNMGLKDQVMALEWVRDNIANFGGDPDRVTIFGDMAGGASVHYHMYSPMSKGLFSAAISQGGTALCSWAYIPHPKKTAYELSHHIGNPTRNMDILVDMLKHMNTTEVVGLVPRFFEWGVNPINPFGVTIETAKDGTPKFLTTSPYRTLQTEPVNNVPWMVGVNDQLGLFAAASITTDPQQVQDINTDWLRLAPLIFYYRGTALDTDTVSELVLREYFKGKPIGNETLPILTDLMSDRLFFQGDRKSILSHFTNTQMNKQPTFLYHFSHHSNSSLVRVLGLEETLGVTEGDDLQYLFNTPFSYFDVISKEHPHYRFSDNFVRLWVHFATHRTTTGATWNSESLNWPAADTQSALKGLPLKMLDINHRQPRLIDEPFKSRVEFWDSLPISEYENEVLPF